MDREDIIEKLLFICASVSTIAIFLIVYYLFKNGVHVLSWDFVFGMTYNPGTDQFGIFPIIVTNFATAMYSLIIATIIGLPTAVFLSEYSPFWLRNIIKPLIEVIVGIPSVVIGFWGLIVLVPIIRNVFPTTQGQSMLTGSIVLAFMTLPTLISLSEDSLRAVPRAYREASLALGSHSLADNHQGNTTKRIQRDTRRDGTSHGQSRRRDHGSLDGNRKPLHPMDNTEPTRYRENTSDNDRP